MYLGFWITWFRYQKLKIFSFEYLVWKHRILLWEEFQPEFVCNSILQKDFISLWILHESCSPVCVDEFELLNRLISISEAQNIPIWISSEKARNPAARRVLARKSDSRDYGPIWTSFFQGLNWKVLKLGI